MRKEDDYLQDLIESMFGLNNIMHPLNNIPRYKPKRIEQIVMSKLTQLVMMLM